MQRIQVRVRVAFLGSETAQWVPPMQPQSSGRQFDHEVQIMLCADSAVEMVKHFNKILMGINFKHLEHRELASRATMRNLLHLHSHNGFTFNVNAQKKPFQKCLGLKSRLCYQTRGRSENVEGDHGDPP